ncbi:MAG: respiratory nitrate reductase subunit gamma [Symbiobacteriia bacterium]
MSLFLWVIYPYIALTIMVVGLIYRYDADPLGWTARSSELLEKWRLMWGSNLFHWGIIFAFFGHVAGILVPLAFYRAANVPDEFYHLNALAAGGLAGVATLLGLLILVVRRLGVRRIFRTSSTGDMVALALLLATAIPGMLTTISHNYEYRLTVGPWFRGLLTLHPDTSLMVGVPLGLQVHILLAMATFAVTPFTRLVHLFSLPLAYLRRAPIQYRLRMPVVESPANRGNKGRPR